MNLDYLNHNPTGNTPYNPTGNTSYNPAANMPYNPAENMPYNPTGNMPYNPAANMPMYNSAPAGNMPYNPAGNMPYNPAGNMPYNPTGNMPMYNPTGNMPMYNPAGNMPMYNPNGPNTQNSNHGTAQIMAWEPYGIRSPRTLLREDELMRDHAKNIDKDWLHAYATYTPYKTSNQAYGYRPVQSQFNQSTDYNQVSNDPRRPSMNTYPTLQGPTQAPMPNLLNRYGLPPLAYRTPRFQAGD